MVMRFIDFSVFPLLNHNVFIGIKVGIEIKSLVVRHTGTNMFYTHFLHGPKEPHQIFRQ